MATKPGGAMLRPADLPEEFNVSTAFLGPHPEASQRVPGAIHLRRERAIRDPVVPRVNGDAVAPSLFEVPVEERGGDVELLGKIDEWEHAPPGFVATEALSFATCGSAVRG